MHVQGQPKPLDVALEGMEGYEGLMDRIWEMLDQVPEEYFERLPKPWGSAERPHRTLTDISFGTPFSADIYRNGTLITRDLAVTESPAHFDSAKHFKSEDAGITVRDLTYEVRRYFQLKPDDVGVIISKVEKGGKGAVAGLKPYEIILSVNDTPIASSADFEKAIGAGGELRLNVKRMTVGRIVKLKLDPAASAGEAAKDPQAPSDGAAENKLTRPSSSSTSFAMPKRKSGPRARATSTACSPAGESGRPTAWRVTSRTTPGSRLKSSIPARSSPCRPPRSSPRRSKLPSPSIPGSISRPTPRRFAPSSGRSPLTASNAPCS